MPAHSIVPLTFIFAERFSGLSINNILNWMFEPKYYNIHSTPEYFEVAHQAILSLIQHSAEHHPHTNLTANARNSVQRENLFLLLVSRPIGLESIRQPTHKPHTYGLLFVPDKHRCVIAYIITFLPLLIDYLYIYSEKYQPKYRV